MRCVRSCGRKAQPMKRLCLVCEERPRSGEDITILQDVETASLKGSETVCESPLCDVSFPESGLACKPKRFCSDECAQQASLIRRTAALFGLTVERMVELLKGKP
jgi:hypothetical protein